jgi:hypothetical protein
LRLLSAKTKYTQNGRFLAAVGKQERFIKIIYFPQAAATLSPQLAERTDFAGHSPANPSQHPKQCAVARAS